MFLVVTIQQDFTIATKHIDMHTSCLLSLLNQRSSRLPIASSNLTQQLRSGQSLSALRYLSVLQHRRFPFHTMSPIPSQPPPEKFPQSFPHPPPPEVEEAFPGACTECPLSTTLFLTIITVAIWPHAPPGRCPCSISPIWCSCLCEFNQHSDTSCSQPDIPFTDRPFGPTERLDREIGFRQHGRQAFYKLLFSGIGREEAWWRPCDVYLSDWYTRAVCNEPRALIIW